MKLATLKEELRREQAFDSPQAKQKINKDFEYIFDEATNNRFRYIFK